MTTTDISADLTVTVHDDGAVTWSCAGRHLTLSEVRGAVNVVHDRLLARARVLASVAAALDAAEARALPAAKELTA